MPEMPVYICHKEVRALKIARVEDRGTDTTSDENPLVEVFFEDERFPSRIFNLRGKPTPDAGWYWVEYPDDRTPPYYWSFSPAKAFEEGYTLKGRKPAPDEVFEMWCSDAVAAHHIGHTTVVLYPSKEDFEEAEPSTHPDYRARRLIVTVVGE